MAVTNSFNVIAEFTVPAAQRDEFLELCVFDSVRSTEDEAGCRQFDVCVSNDNPLHIVLYESYADQAAFDVHMTTPHYKTFAAGVERLEVSIVHVRFLSRHYPVD